MSCLTLHASMKAGHKLDAGVYVKEMFYGVTYTLTKDVESRKRIFAHRVAQEGTH